MKNRFLLLIALVFIFNSCDDGELIVTNFDFDEDTSLQNCSTENETVIFAIETEPNETIFFKFNETDFTSSFEGVGLDTTQTYEVNNNNQIIYRSLSNTITADYFCNTIPPTQSNVKEEYISTNGGTVTFTTTVNISTANDADTDGDGVTDIIEGKNETPQRDTDGDGIPDYLDKDDDNDNVLTQVENNPANEEFEGIFPDTDQDGIPNYLDDDDDNDGIITRHEDLNAADNATPENPDDLELDPTNDDTNGNDIPNYLDPEDTGELVINEVKPNKLSRTFTTLVTARNITLVNTVNQDQITLQTLILGRLQVTETVSVEAETE